MRFYRATRFIFPRSYRLRIFVICFGAVHIPLAAFCVMQMSLDGWDWRLFRVLLLATLAGTCIAIGAIAALLAPIEKAIGLLKALQAGLPISTVPIGGGDIVGELLTAVGRAAAENARRIDRLRAAAEIDLLTGVRNRRGFLDALPTLLRPDQAAVVALIDLDHFKSINDRFGHEEGDRILATFAARLDHGVRRSDICARWGGEEFAVLLPDTSIDAAHRVMERLRLSLLSDPIGVDDFSLTFSCGLAGAVDAPALNTALREADIALYQAKAAGRNLVLRYEETAPPE
jgi:diguanylate cyclase (GGDEF)-like protein